MKRTSSSKRNMETWEGQYFYKYQQQEQ